MEDVVQVGVFALLTVAGVAPLFFVWRDDHKPNPHLARPLERKLEDGRPLRCSRQVATQGDPSRVP